MGKNYRKILKNMLEKPVVVRDQRELFVYVHTF